MILDTNAVSGLSENDRALLARLSDTPILHLPVIVLGEYRFGLRQSSRRRAYETWLDALIGASSVLDVDVQTTDHYANLRIALKRAGRPIPENDLWIAALARQHELPIVSRDTHFDLVPGVRRLSW